MRQRRITFLIPALAAFLVAGPTVAQAQIASATRSAMTLKQMTISADYVDAPISAFIKNSQKIAAGPHHDVLLRTALLKSGAQDVQNPTITTTDGVMGRMDITTVPAVAPANAQPNFFSENNFVEATPRSNADGTITVAIKMQQVVAIMGISPVAPTENLLSTSRTLHDGQTLMLGGFLDPTNAKSTMRLIFLKVATVKP